MKASDGHRNRCGLRRPITELDDGRDESRIVHQHPCSDNHPRRHRRGDDRQRRHRLELKRVPSLYKMVFSAEAPDMRGQLDQLVFARRQGATRRAAGAGHPLDESLHAQRPAAHHERDRPGDGAHDPQPRSTSSRHPDEAPGGAFREGQQLTTMGIASARCWVSCASLPGHRQHVDASTSIFAAFIATLMIGSANVIFLPIRTG